MGEIIDKPELKHEPTWDVAQLFPPQGDWSEAEYLALDTNHLVEFSQGFVEFLPMPTLSHQRARCHFRQRGVSAAHG